MENVIMSDNQINNVINPSLSPDTNIKPKKTKKIILIILVILAIFTGLYFYFISRANLFIRINTEIEVLNIDYKIIDGFTSENWRFKVNSGNHSINIAKSGYLDYYKTIKTHKWFPTFLNINLVKAKVIGSPSANTSTELGVSSAEYFSISPDEKYIFYFDSAKNTLNKFMVATSGTKSDMETLNKLDFLSDEQSAGIANVKWSIDEQNVLITTNYLDNDESITEYWVMGLINGNKEKINDIFSNIIEVDWASESKLFLVNKDDKIINLYLKDINNSNLNKIAQFDSSNYYFSISPDNKKVSYLSNKNGKIVVNIYDLQSNKNIEIITEDNLSSGRKAIWSPDSSKLAYGYGDTNLFIINIDGKSELIKSSDKIYDFLWLPDSKGFILVQNNSTDGANIYITISNLEGKNINNPIFISTFPLDILLSKSTKKIYLNLSGTLYEVEP